MDIPIPQDLPFLSAICWQLPQVRSLSPAEMLHSYERGWHYRGVLGDLSEEEQTFVNSLVQCYGSWLNCRELNGGPVEQFQHQQILHILECLNREFLRNCGAYFGGGTLLAMQYGEYRLSRDIDFLCSSASGYRSLRQAVFEHQYNALFQNHHRLNFPREIQANHYGLRFPVELAGQQIRVEIVSEGRIDLGNPDQLDWCPVASLNSLDLAVEKLLANSDRWNDESALSRDLIDLAMLRYQDAFPLEAIAKAEAAYPVLEPLRRSLAWFESRPAYRERCYQLLQVQAIAQIEVGLRCLQQDLSIT
jgi:hypothetical protein